MDLLYGHDRKLDYLDETDMVDFLDSNDIFQTPVTGFPTPEECYENDWLTSFLDDPVLNDKMMTDAMQPPCIKSEHSYSITDSASTNGYVINCNNIQEAPGSPLGLARCEDIDTDYFGTHPSALDLTMKTNASSSPSLHPNHKSVADALISTDAFLASCPSSISSSSSLSYSSSLSQSSSSSTPPPSSSSTSSSSSSPSSSSCFPSISPIKVEIDVAPSSVTTPTAGFSASEAASATTSLFGGGRQPTIIVTNTTSAASSSSLSSSSSCILGSSYLTSDLALPAIEIKEEPMDDNVLEHSVGIMESIALPPTPPGSSGSDSDGSQSPQRSAPSSPIRHHSSSLRHHHSSSPLSPGKSYSQPLFVNPISQSGVLLLSEEEKRTLISEGYPIPTKLPLTKQEEKNLKKIRRKIKNKISAQESRRKKKEYLEALEKRVEAYNHENSDLKKKVESLESSNRSLIGQLQKLQSLVKMPKASQTGTALMVLVFCFAVFLGSMSPSSLNIGYATKPGRLGFVPQSQQGQSQRSFYGPEIGPMMMTAHDTSEPYEPADPYVTPKLKSRVLMSVETEYEQCEDFRSMPWDSAPSCPMADSNVKAASTLSQDKEELSAPGIKMVAGADLPDSLTTNSDTTVVMVMPGIDNQSHTQQVKVMSSVIPEVTLNAKDIVGPSSHHHRMAGNFTTEIETA